MYSPPPGRLGISEYVRELLDPTHPSAAEALEACRRYLRARWRGFPVAHASLPRKERDDLVPLFAWHSFVRQTVREAPDDDARRDALQVLRRVAREIDAASPTCALSVAARNAAAHHGLSPLLFAEPLAELARGEHVHAFETRGELLRHARRIALPEVRLYARVLGLTSDRSELLAEALGLGLQLVDWLVHFDEDLEHGRLHLAVEDLAAHGVDILSMRERTASAGMVATVAAQIAWARELLAKGWPLCAELGPWRGRQLAFVLRWHAASLSALEAKGCDAGGAVPRGGAPRMIACAASCAVSSGRPRF